MFLSRDESTFWEPYTWCVLHGHYIYTFKLAQPTHNDWLIWTWKYLRRCPSRDTSWTRDGTEWNRGIPKQYRVKSRQRRDHCIIILMMTSSFLVFSWWCCRTCVCHSRITVFSFFLFETGDPLDPFDNCVIDSYHYVITVFVRSIGTVTFQRYNYVITVQLSNRENDHNVTHSWWFQNLERAHQSFVNTHHATSIVKLSTIIWCGK